MRGLLLSLALLGASSFVQTFSRRSSRVRVASAPQVVPYDVYNQQIALLKELKESKDAEIARLHDSGVAWRKARIAQLMTQSDSFYMYARLLQMPATKVLPMEQQRRLINALGDMRQAEMRRKKGV